MPLQMISKDCYYAFIVMVILLHINMCTIWALWLCNLGENGIAIFFLINIVILKSKIEKMFAMLVCRFAQFGQKS